MWIDKPMGIYYLIVKNPINKWELFQHQPTNPNKLRPMKGIKDKGGIKRGGWGGEEWRGVVFPSPVGNWWKTGIYRTGNYTGLDYFHY